MGKSSWVSLFLTLGVSAIGVPAWASPPVGTISNFTGNLAATVCNSPEGIALDPQSGNFFTASDRDGDTVGTVCVFRPNGAFKSSIAVPAGAAGVVALLGLLFEPPRTLFAVDIADGVRVRVLRSTITSVVAKPDPAAAREAAKQRENARAKATTKD